MLAKTWKVQAFALVIAALCASPASAQNLYSIDRSGSDCVVSFTRPARVRVVFCDSGIWGITDVGPSNSVTIRPGQWAQLEIPQIGGSTWSTMTDVNRC
jgi:hypothetical protein